MGDKTRDMRAYVIRGGQDDGRKGGLGASVNFPDGPNTITYSTMIGENVRSYRRTDKKEQVGSHECTVYVPEYEP